MELYRSIQGRIQVKYTSADIPSAVEYFRRQGIILWDLEQKDVVTIVFWIERIHMASIRRIAQKRGESVCIQRKSGAWWYMCQLYHRPVLVIGIAFLLIFSLWLPGRILFVQVEGNENVPTRQILEAAGKCGIVFGASRREVRSEKVKNNLLQEMHELSWAGVNTNGCTAVISVKERKVLKYAEETGVVSSIVADCDGIIRSVTVTKGTALVAPGQAVKAGQVLISGYTDCGLLIRAARAEGEVYAQTSRAVCAICPVETAKRAVKKEIRENYSLILGKKRINFVNNSRISDTICVKIYEENYWVLPGGFVLPVAIAVERWISYETEADTWTPDLQLATQHYLLGQVRSGKLLKMDPVFTQEDGILILQADCSCYERIGITRIEERLSQHGENH